MQFVNYARKLAAGDAILLPLIESSPAVSFKMLNEFTRLAKRSFLSVHIQYHDQQKRFIVAVCKAE